MSALSSNFTRDDIEIMIEAVGDWEMVGNHEYHVLSMIKAVPMPPDDHEAFEHIVKIKDYFKGREKDILASRVTRQEKAVFLKAKLMMVRRDLGVSTLFDMAANAEETGHLSPPKEIATAIEATPVMSESEAVKKLQLAEDFIKDMGVVSYYEKFLSERKDSCKSGD